MFKPIKTVIVFNLPVTRYRKAIKKVNAEEEYMMVAFSLNPGWIKQSKGV